MLFHSHQRATAVACLAVLALVHPANAASQAFGMNGCAVANQAIWCYGGATGINGAQLTSKTSTLTKLDMSNYDFFNLQFNWQIVTPNNFVLEENWRMSMTSAQNETGLFIFGGMGLGSAPVNPVITYNGQSNAWKGTTTLPTDWNNTYPFLPTVVDLSSIGRTQAWIWGGAINGTDTGISPNVQLFDYNANTWSSSAQATPGGSIRYYHTASLSNDGASIFVLGGTSMRPGQVGESPIDMTEVWVFSTANGQWITVTGSSDTKLLGRQYHTAVTIPNSSLLFIYGGEQTFPPNATRFPILNGTDVALVYDYSANHFYTPQINGNNTPGPRAFHTSVVYTDRNSSSSFVAILFGANSQFQLESSTYFLNVTNPTNLTWVANNSNPNDFPAGGNNGTATPANSGGLSTGAIAGIAVAAVVVAIGGCAALLFWYHRHRKNKQDFEVQQTDPRYTIDETYPDMNQPMIHDSHEHSETSDTTGNTATHSSSGRTKPTIAQEESIKPFGNS